jgi:hypothetical protein
MVPNDEQAPRLDDRGAKENAAAKANVSLGSVGLSYDDDQTNRAADRWSS